MQLLLKNDPVLEIRDSGVCKVLDFERLPFALRRQQVSYADFVEWAMNRTLSMGRSYAKEILNSLRLSQNNRYAVFKACRGLSLSDSYWIRQEGDWKTWEEVSLFQNPLMLFVTEVSLSGRRLSGRWPEEPVKTYHPIHTPELTTMGVSAKSWIRQGDGLYLHKVGKYEIPADEILTVLGIPHISYQISTMDEIDAYLAPDRKAWLADVGEVIVNSRIFTTENRALVTFEEFAEYCGAYGKNPYQEAMVIDRDFYLKMQVADYILNNSDRHQQNWGFFMDNRTGKISGFCPLFDHDRAFSGYQRVLSQAVEDPMTLEQAAAAALKALGSASAGLDVVKALGELEKWSRPEYLTKEQWNQVLERKRCLIMGQ